jgi:hypothetical protein
MENFQILLRILNFSIAMNHWGMDPKYLESTMVSVENFY